MKKLDRIRNEIIEGLLLKQKKISSKYFYDKKGSQLFEQITLLDEYYPSHTEKLILKKVANSIVSVARDINIIELGSGDHSKISILLNGATNDNINSMQYTPVDISKSALNQSCSNISKHFPKLKVQGIVCDFMTDFEMPVNGNKRLICFFGSTLGNLLRNQAANFLQNISKNMQVGDSFLLGLDMVKDKKILETAYNDKKNITANFNKNILNVVNNTIETNFNISDFEHLAYYNNDKRRIEMHLKTIKDIEISSKYFTEKIKLTKGETIHTENSHKFTKDDINEFSVNCNLKIEKVFTDENNYFSLVHFVK